MDLAINFLPHNRRYLMLHTLKEFSKTNEKYKNKFKIYIHDNIDNDYVKDILKDINYEIVNHGTHNYITKINYAINLHHAYSMKIDEDIFMNHHVLEYVLDNLNLISDENFILSPILSTGIPSTEMFVDDFCPEEKENIFKMFCDTHVCNLWGANYSSLNYNKSRWCANEYYDKVNQLDHYYKGIHPIRINVSIQNFLLNVIKNKKQKLYEKQEYYTESKQIPYICNSLFVIKTDEWKKIITNGSLYRDEYDEVPLNLYMKQFDKNVLFVRNANCIHPVYNTVDVFNQGMYNSLSIEWNKILEESV